MHVRSDVRRSNGAHIRCPVLSTAGYVKVGSSKSCIGIVRNVITFGLACSEGGVLSLSLSIESTWWVYACAAMRGHCSLRCVRKVRSVS